MSDWRETPLDLRGQKIWVAGHRGMVGAAMMRRLVGEGCALIVQSDTNRIDLREQTKVRAFYAAHKPDMVIVAAAKVGGIGANAAYPAEFLYDNLMIEANVIHGAYEAGVKRLLFLGSSCIYPRDCPQPMKEEYLLTGALEPTNEPYALAKIAGLKLVQAYRRQYGCDFISAMPCNLLGVGDRYDAQNSHVVPALILKAHQAKIAGQKVLRVWGSGKPLREFLDVDELADALVLLLKRYHGDAPINIGSGMEISIQDLVKIICDVVGFEGEIIFDPSKPDGTPRKILDSSHIFEIGWASEMCQNHGAIEAITRMIGKCYTDFLKGHDYGGTPHDNTRHSGGRARDAAAPFDE